MQALPNSRQAGHRSGTWIGLLLLLAGAAGADTISYSYDDAGRLIRASYANGKVINYTYDKAGNLTSRVTRSATAPVITGVVNGANFLPGIAASSWVTIQGSNLSSTTRAWRDSDFVNGKLPTQLDGVSATVNGKAAFVYYVSPTQLNVLAPDDTATGPVPVQVTNAGGPGNSFTANENAVSPAFFLFSPKYPAAVHTTGIYVGPAGLIAGGNFAPAKPGETILLFGTGFGPTNPALPAGQLVTTAAPLVNSVTVKIGGKTATVPFSGLSGSGLDQLNVTIPSGLPDGDAALEVTVLGSSTQANLFLPIHH
jgi:uncharacterized protein (TIGR03437 family)